MGFKTCAVPFSSLSSETGLQKKGKIGVNEVWLSLRKLEKKTKSIIGYKLNTESDLLQTLKCNINFTLDYSTKINTR